MGRRLTSSQRATAAAMRDELEGSFLEVALVPAPEPRHEGHCIRVVVSRNPDWYRRLCRTRTKLRRRPRQRRVHDTDIRRPSVLRALDRLARGVCRHPYDFLLLPIVIGEAPPF